MAKVARSLCRAWKGAWEGIHTPMRRDTRGRSTQVIPEHPASGLGLTSQMHKKESQCSCPDSLLCPRWSLTAFHKHEPSCLLRLVRGTHVPSAQLGRAAEKVGLQGLGWEGLRGGLTWAGMPWSVSPWAWGHGDVALGENKLTTFGAHSLFCSHPVPILI